MYNSNIAGVLGVATSADKLISLTARNGVLP